MKIRYYILFAVAALSTVSCSDEETPRASENLTIAEKYAPGDKDSKEVHQMYNDYGVWVRMDFNDPKEVYITPLASDDYCKGMVKIKEEDKASAVTYSQTFLSNVSKEFALKAFPPELFFVQTYGASYWIYSFKQLGRVRLVIEWPNKYKGTIPITDPENHYYQDSVLTANVWGYWGSMISNRITPIDKFIQAGKMYDNGEAYDNILDQYYKDDDLEKRDAAIEELCRIGGYITGGGSRKFGPDFSSWIQLIALESYENIKRDYLDNSPARKAKYDVLIAYFNEYKWDIQAAGNKFRQKYDEYKASLPEPEPEPEPEPTPEEE